MARLAGTQVAYVKPHGALGNLAADRRDVADAIVAALQVLTAVCESGKTLGVLAGDLKLYPQVLLNVKVERGFDWQKSATVTKAKQAAERQLGKKGRVLLRPSGTEPVLRVMVMNSPWKPISPRAGMR